MSQDQMPSSRKQRSIDERLADAQARQAQAKAKLQALEVQKKQRDARLRGQGEKTMLRVLLQQMRAEPTFRGNIAALLDRAALRPDERNAVNWLMGSLEPANAAGNAAPVDQQVA